MESAFSTTVGPQAIIKIHRNAEDSVCGLLGASVGEHTRGTLTCRSSAFTTEQLAAGLGQECLQSLTGLEEKTQTKLNNLLACVRIQAHTNFSRGPDLSFLGGQPGAVIELT